MVARTHRRVTQILARQVGQLPIVAEQLARELDDLREKESDPFEKVCLGLAAEQLRIEARNARRQAARVFGGGS